MANFFGKLKKGMGIGVQLTEKEGEKPEQNQQGQRVEKVKKEVPKIREEKKDYNPPTASSHSPKGERAPEIEVKKENLSGGIPQGFPLENLSRKEGELAVDLYQNEGELVIRSAIAGVKPENLNILIEQDIISISGNREEPGEKGKIDYFTRECYFGPFSRKIISPVEIDPSRAKATMKEGILLIRIPKIQKEKKIKLEIKKE